MTFREKLGKDRPDLVNDVLFRGGCAGCPSEYGYEEGAAKDALCIRGRVLFPTDKMCRECWDRECEEDKVKQSSMYSFVKQRFMKQKDSNLG